VEGVITYLQISLFIVVFDYLQLKRRSGCNTVGKWNLYLFPDLLFITIILLKVYYDFDKEAGLQHGHTVLIPQSHITLSLLIIIIALIIFNLLIVLNHHWYSFLEIG